MSVLRELYLLTNELTFKYAIVNIFLLLYQTESGLRLDDPYPHLNVSKYQIDVHNLFLLAAHFHSDRYRTTPLPKHDE